MARDFPGQVSTLDIVAIDVFHYSGPVYDLETDSSLYILENGVAISNCNCTQRPIKPGQSAAPFIDYQAEVAALGPAGQRHAMGASNWALVESGAAKWEDVVTKGRIRDFREVADRLHLDVDDLVKAGVKRGQAVRAYDTTHTAAHLGSDAERKALITGLRNHGVKDERIVAEVASLLGKRTAAVEIGGQSSPPPVASPPPAPGSGPKPAPAVVPPDAEAVAAGLTPARKSFLRTVGEYLGLRWIWER